VAADKESKWPFEIRKEHPMSIRFRLLSCAAAALTVLSFGVTAQPAAEGVFMPQEHAQGNVTYLSGGIGVDEADMLRQQSANYPLTLELATAAGGPRDAYVSDARVDIRDGNGNPVLTTTTQGPLMLLRLPSGTYTVAVDWHGTRKSKTVAVSSDRRQHVLLEFPDDPSNH
jgi:hypothetical protein